MQTATTPPNSLLFNSTTIVWRLPKDMRYDTVADWRYSHNHLDIIIPDCDLTNNNPIFVYLLVNHERTEAELCQYRGVTSQEVDDYDMDYEAAREAGDESEPGDQPEAPYHWQHTTAEASERLLAAALDVTWGHYMRWIDDLFDLVKHSREDVKHEASTRTGKE